MRTADQLQAQRLYQARTTVPLASYLHTDLEFFNSDLSPVSTT